MTEDNGRHAVSVALTRAERDVLHVGINHGTDPPKTTLVLTDGAGRTFTTQVDPQDITVELGSGHPNIAQLMQELRNLPGLTLEEAAAPLIAEIERIDRQRP